MLGTFDLPALDTLSPGYKFFDIHEDKIMLRPSEDQIIIPANENRRSNTTFSSYRIMRSPQPRPGGEV